MFNTPAMARLDGAVGQYGRSAAAWMMTALDRVPIADRQPALRALLASVDPKLPRNIDIAAAQLRASGLPARTALEAAIANEMAKGMGGELEAAGRRVLRGQPGFKRKGHAAMVAPTAQATAQYEALNALGLSFSSVGHAIAGGARAAAGFVADGAHKLGGLACNVVSNDSAITAATVANPAVGAGAMAARGMCPKPKPKPTKGGTPPRAGATGPAGASGSSLPSWALPAAAVGGGVILLLLLRKA